METQVQTYLQEEADALIADVDQREEFENIINELGMKGQQSLIGENETPLPFPVMTTEEYEVYKALLDEEESFTDFDSEVIPMRVLSLIKLAKDEDYFDDIKIRYASNVDDPIVYGRTKNEDGWGYKHYMIGRWGDELLDFPSLKEMAREKLHRKYKTELTETKEKATLQLKTVDALVEKKLNGKNVFLA